MPPRDDARTKLIVELLDKRLKISDVAKTAQCHIGTVYRVQKNLKCFNAPRPPPSVLGRPKKLNTEFVRGIEEFSGKNPEASLERVAQFVKKEYGVSVSRATLSRTLKAIRARREKEADCPACRAKGNDHG